MRGVVEIGTLAPKQFCGGKIRIFKATLRRVGPVCGTDLSEISSYIPTETVLQKKDEEDQIFTEHFLRLEITSELS